MKPHTWTLPLLLIAVFLLASCQKKIPVWQRRIKAESVTSQIQTTEKLEQSALQMQALEKKEENLQNKQEVK